jgi:hypothetical protein
MTKYEKLSDLMKKRFTKKTALRMLTKTKAGRIASIVLVASGIHEATKTKKKKTKEPLSSKLKKLSEYTAKYEGKGWKNFIKEEWKKGKKEWGIDKETLLKKKKVDKKSIGGETVIMKSGGGYIDDLL